MNRRNQFTPSLAESLEPRTLLSAVGHGRQALVRIDRDITKFFAREGNPVEGGYLASIIANDLNYEGVFAALSQQGRRRTMVSLLTPPTEQQTLAAFQSAYSQAMIVSAPAAAQLLAEDAALAVAVYTGTGFFYNAAQNGIVYALGTASGQFQRTLKNISTILAAIEANPLFQTPEGQELAITGEEIAISQVVDGQPINFPTPQVQTPTPTPTQYFPPPQQLPPQISVSPQSLTFQTTQGQNPQEQGFAVSNVGGGTLHCTEKTNTSWIGLTDEGTSLGAAIVGVQVNAALLTPGTYYGTIIVSSPDDPNGTQIVAVTLNVAAPPAPTYRGSFTGRVSNADNDGGGDPGPTFYDQYGGQVSMTLTGSPGNYTLTFQGTLTNPNTNQEEDFTANFNIYVTVQNLANIRFTTPMGDGQMLATGAIANGTFSGTWVFQQTNPIDFSDSGQGTFSLST